MVYITNQEFWNRLIRLIGAGDDSFQEKYLNRLHLGEDWEDFMTSLKTWFGDRPKLQIMQDAEAARIPITAFLQMDELIEHPHFRSRGAYVEADHPVAGTLRYLGAPWRMANGYQLKATAPLLGQHDEQVRHELTATAAGRA
jgi:crotonobetainyl-CoA:carnitine CoA-transferase CaiB-like acyl-CoA transferase